MEAREVLARWLAVDGLDVNPADPWGDAGEEMHTAYLAAADEIIEELGRAGFLIVRRSAQTNPGIPQEGD